MLPWTPPLKIQCDDTDVFVLMVHYVHKYQLKNTVLMEATKSGRQAIDIHLSIEKMVSAGYDQCATGYPVPVPVPVPVPANPANIFQSGSGSGSGQILAGLAGFLKIIQKFSKMLKM